MIKVPSVSNHLRHWSYNMSHYCQMGRDENVAYNLTAPSNPIVLVNYEVFILEQPMYIITNLNFHIRAWQEVQPTYLRTGAECEDVISDSLSLSFPARHSNLSLSQPPSKAARCTLVPALPPPRLPPPALPPPRLPSSPSHSHQKYLRPEQPPDWSSSSRYAVLRGDRVHHTRVLKERNLQKRKASKS